MCRRNFNLLFYILPIITFYSAWSTSPHELFHDTYDTFYEIKAVLKKIALSDSHKDPRTKENELDVSGFCTDVDPARRICHRRRRAVLKKIKVVVKKIALSDSHKDPRTKENEIGVAGFRTDVDPARRICHRRGRAVKSI